MQLVSPKDTFYFFFKIVIYGWRLLKNRYLLVEDKVQAAAALVHNSVAFDTAWSHMNESYVVVCVRSLTWLVNHLAASI